MRYLNSLIIREIPKEVIDLSGEPEDVAAGDNQSIELGTVNTLYNVEFSNSIENNS